MSKKEVYRFKKGKLIGENVETPIDFGLVFEEEGIYMVEIYVPDSFNLRAFSEEPYTQRSDLKIFCTTEDKNELEIRGLYVSGMAFEPRRIRFDCHDCLIHTDISPFDDKPSDIKTAELFYLEIEGLKMEFCDHTMKSEFRVSSNQKSSGPSIDHTEAKLLVDLSPYSQIFRKSYLNQNIVVEFNNKPGNKLLYENFLTFKSDYISILALLNGADVKIRKEYIGECITTGSGDIHSDIVITYSFRKVQNESFNKYIPLGYRIQNVNPNILSQVMIQNFNNFREWNKNIDLRSIIFYLNGAEQARSVEEKFFIQIIAFERLSALYAEHMGFVDTFLPCAVDFEPIKQIFLELLQKHKISFGDNYDTARSKIGNINAVKPFSTEEKMTRIIKDVNIQIDSDLKNLIEIVRHKAIHKGDVGSGQEGIKNLYLLNELLREIILRLIKYEGPRVSRILLDKTLF